MHEPSAFELAQAHKQLKVSHSNMPARGAADYYQDYIESPPLTPAQVRNSDDNSPLAVGEIIEWWNNRYHTWPDLARFALDVLAVPPMSDDVERLFSGASIMLERRRRRLGMDSLEANECRRACYGPLIKGTFDDLEHAESLGASRDESSTPRTLKSIAAACVQASQRAEREARQQQGDDYEVEREGLEAAEEDAIAARADGVIFERM
jgi:hypothetical protein